MSKIRESDMIAIEFYSEHSNESIDDNLNDDNETILENENASSLLETGINVITLTLEEQIQEIESTKKSEQYLSAPYKCDLCAKWWLHEFSYNTHLSRHDEQSSGKLKCQVCHQLYLTKKNYRNHILTHEVRYECKLCNRVFCSRAAINQHLKQHDGSGLKYICTICNKQSSSRSIHRKHLLTHNPEKNFLCPHCPCTFQYSGSRNRHITRIHTEEEKIACNICHLTFTNEDSLKLHTKKHSVTKDFYCAECDVIFKSKATLNEHLKFSGRHMDSKFLTYMCTMCDKKYHNAIKLKRHVQSSHLREKNYKCKSCSATFQTPGGLRSHIVFHHEGRKRPKNKICNICQRGFASKMVLQNHIVTHTGERPHVCHLCSSSFSQKSSLIKHVDVIHNQIKTKRKRAIKKGDSQINNVKDL